MQIPEIDVTQAKSLHEEGAAMFIDVRDPQSHAAGHIPGALSLDDQTVGEFIANTDKAQAIVVYCYHGNASRGAAGFFIEQGFSEVKSLTGGFTEWQAAGGDARTA